MTAEIINLNKVRKARARAERAAQAAENRAKFGRSKVERTQIAAEGEKLRRELDGTRRETADVTPDAPVAAETANHADDEDSLDPGTVS